MDDDPVFLAHVLRVESKLRSGVSLQDSLRTLFDWLAERHFRTSAPGTLEDWTATLNETLSLRVYQAVHHRRWRLPDHQLKRRILGAFKGVPFDKHGPFDRPLTMQELRETYWADRICHWQAEYLDAKVQPSDTRQTRPEKLRQFADAAPGSKPKKKRYSERDDEVFRKLGEQVFRTKSNQFIAKQYRATLGTLKGESLRSMLNRIRSRHDFPRSDDLK